MYRNATEVQFVLRCNVMPYMDVIDYGEAGPMDSEVAFHKPTANSKCQCCILLNGMSAE
jgi:hypothetical protein